MLQEVFAVGVGKCRILEVEAWCAVIGHEVGVEVVEKAPYVGVVDI